ncbi:MAG: 2-phospho-L-lactate guanylyltransferase [Chloroflexota bacterium]
MSKHQAIITTIIPVKPFSEAKTRLSPVLTINERANLSRYLFLRTLKIVIPISNVIVVSRSKTILRLAEEKGAWPIPEPNNNLNEAIQLGLAHAKKKASSGYLILPTDLPCLNSKALAKLMAIGLGETPQVVITPCQQESGTNALFLNPADIIPPRFGPNSFTKHTIEAKQRGVPLHIHRSPDLAFDLDTPKNWQQFVDMMPTDFSPEWYQIAMSNVSS